MNDEIFFDGSKYISAAGAAATAGFTRDYIARLSRSGKIVGKQIGKQWYVSEKSLREFLVGQEYGLSKRRESLRSERRQEYQSSLGRASDGSLVGARKNADALVSHPYELPPYARALPRSETFLRPVVQAFEESLRAKEEKKREFARRRFTSRTHAAHGAFPLIGKLPLHAIPPVVEFLHKVVALALAFMLTFGTYALVDTQNARIAADTLKDAGPIAINAAQQLAAAATDPEGALSSAAEHLARSFNRGLDSLVYAILFPDARTRSTSSSGIPRILVRITPHSTSLGGALASGETVSHLPAAPQTASNTIVERVVVERAVPAGALVKAGGITEDILNQRLNELDNKLMSKIYGVSSSPGPITYVSTPPASGGIENQIALSQRFDTLNGTRISKATITGSDISGSAMTGGTIAGTAITGSSIGATDLSVSGATALATTTVTGDLSVTGAVTFSGTPLSAVNATFVNSTTTNSTSTNSYISNLSAVTASTTNLTASVSAALGTTTITNLAVTNTSTSTFAGGFSIAGTGFVYQQASGRIGVGTSSPASIFDIYGTDALRLPVGTTGNRPTLSGTGQVRYNTSTHQFEGFGDNSVWQGLGGVIDADQSTYITADTNNADEDYLRFFTNGLQRLTITNNGNFGVGSTTPLAKFAIHAQNGDTNRLLFEVASSTASATSSLFSILNTGQVGVGTNAPDTSAFLQLDSTGKGFLGPRMTTAQKNAIASPASGLMVYDTTLNKLNVYNGSAWKNVGSTEINGEVTNGTTGSVLFIGDGAVLGQDNANFAYSTSTNTLTLAKLSLTAGTSTNFFATTASSTNLYAQAASVGTLAASGAATLSSTLGVSSLSTFQSGFLSNASSTITSGLFSANGGASTTNFTASGSSWLSGGFLSQASSTVTGQFTTINASSTLLSVSGTAWFGTATSTNLNANTANLAALTAGTLSLTAGTTTNFFATIASSTNLYAQTATLGALTANSLTVNGLSNFSGLDTFTSGYVSQASSTVVGDFTATGNSIHGGTLTQTGLATFTNGSISNASSTITSGLFSANGGASTTNFTASGSSWLSGGFLSQASSTVTGQFTTINASSTLLSVSGTAWFGTATSTNLNANTANLAALTAGTLSLTAGTTTNFFATIASSTNLYAQTATLGALSLGNALATGSGGTGTSTWQTNSLAYFNGTRFTEDNANLNYNGSKLTATNASTTNLSASTAFYAPFASAVMLTDANKLATAATTQTCTNQFFRSLSAAYIVTCQSVVDADFSGQLAPNHGGTGQDASAFSGVGVWNTGVYSASSTLAIYRGGTGASSFAGDSIIVSNAAGSALAASSTLAVNHGGTGASTFAANGVLFGNGTGAIQATAAAANSILVTDGSNIPSFSTTLPAHTLGGDITGNGKNITGLNNLTATGLSQLTNASSSLFSVFTKAYFGGSATTTIDSAGNVAIAGTLGVTGASTFSNATSTNFFATVASSTNLFSQTATLGALTANTLTVSGNTTHSGTLTQTGLATFTNGYISNASSTITSGLFSMNGGASTTAFTASGASFLNGGFLSQASSTVTGQFTTINSSSTLLSVSGTAWFGTATSTNLNANTATLGSLTVSGGLTSQQLATFTSGFLSNASSTITSGLFSMNGGASTTNFTASGTGYFGAINPTTDNTVYLGTSTLRFKEGNFGPNGVNIWNVNGVNYEEGSLAFNASNVLQLQTQAPIAGNYRDIQIKPGTSNGLYLNTSGQAGLGYTSEMDTSVGTALMVNGRIGIGTSTASGPLVVNLNGRATGDLRYGLNITNTDSANTYATNIAFEGGGGSAAAAGNWFVGTDAIHDKSSNFFIATSTGASAYKQFVFNNEGSFTLGDTSAPATPTNKLYSVGGVLYWNSVALNGSVVNYWTRTGSNLTLNTASDMTGLGTSTPNAKLTVASSTGPQLSLTDGSASSNAWTFRSISNSLYIATSTYSATSSSAAAYFNGNGVLSTGAIIPKGTITNNLGSYDLGATGSRWNALWAGTVNVGTSTFSLKTDSAQNLGIFTAASGGGTQAMTITGAGNVGIGSSTPASPLSVSGGTGTYAAYFHNTTAGTAGSSGLRIDVDRNTSDNTGLDVRASGSSLLYVRGDGNVGIGTTSPLTSLHVQSSSNTANLYLDTTGTHGSAINFYSGDVLKGAVGASGAWLGTTVQDMSLAANSGLGINFYVNGSGTASQVITSAGNVGIGTTSPNTLLTVAGSANFGVNSNINVAAANAIVNIGNGSTLNDFSISSGSAYGLIVEPVVAVTNNATAVYGTYTWSGTNVSAGKTLTNQYGQYIAAPSNTGSGTVTNAYGLYVNAPTAGSNNVAAYFDGNVGVGTTTPGSLLTVSKDQSAITSLRVTNYSTNSSAAAESMYINDTGGIFEVGKYGSNQSAPYTNRGVIYDPGAGLLLFAAAASGDIRLNTGGNTTARMTINSSGNVGIGTTSPATKLTVEGTGSIGNYQITVNDSAAMAKDVGGGITFRGYYTTGGAIANFGSIKAGKENVTSGDYAGYLALSSQTGGVETEKMRITSGGNVGIGTTTPSGSLQIANDSTVYSTTAAHIVGSASSNLIITPNPYGTDATARSLIIKTLDSSDNDNLGRARLTFEGGDADTQNAYFTNVNLGIGTTTPTNTLFVANDSASVSAETIANYLDGYGLFVRVGGVSTAGGQMIRFISGDGSQTVGSIDRNTGTTVAYNTSSDRRLKENIAPTASGLTTLMQIPVEDFNFISDPANRVQGFIAQDLYKYYPYAVTTHGTPADGPLATSSQAWSVDYGRLTPLLARSIQELNQKFNDYIGSGTATTTNLVTLNSTTTNTNELCLGGDCRTAWPVVATSTTDLSGYASRTVLDAATSSLASTFASALVSSEASAKADLEARSSQLAATLNSATSSLSAIVASTTAGFAVDLDALSARYFSLSSDVATEMASTTNFAYLLQNEITALGGGDSGSHASSSISAGVVNGIIANWSFSSSTNLLAIDQHISVPSLALGDGGLTFTDGSHLFSSSGLVSTSTLASGLLDYVRKDTVDSLQLTVDSNTNAIAAQGDTLQGQGVTLAALAAASSTYAKTSDLASYLTFTDLPAVVLTEAGLSSFVASSTQTLLGNYVTFADLPSPVTLANLSGTVTGDVVPNADNQYSLGTAQNRFTNIFAKNVNAGDLTFTETTSAISGSTLNAGDIVSLYVSSTAGSTHTVPINLNTAINSNNWSSNNIFFNTSGDFAIGVASTTAPRGKLDVEGAIASGDPRFLTLANTSGSNGNAALPYSFYIPSTTGDLNIASNDNGQGSLVNTSYSAWNIALGGQSDTFNIKRSGTGTQNYASLLTVRNNGNVGIGTTSPYAMLSVAGQVVGTYFTATSTSQASSLPYASSTAISASGATYFNGLSTIGGFLSTASSTITSGLFTANGGASTTNLTASGTGYFGLGQFTNTTGTTTIASGQGFTIGSTQLVLQQGSGNVGIGTAGPYRKLDVAGSMQLGTGALVNSAAGSLFIANANNDSAGSVNGSIILSRYWASDSDTRSASIFHGYNNGNDQLVFGISNAGVPNTYANAKMVIQNNGNVGIGTTSPVQLLSVYSATTPSINFSAATASNNWTMGVDTADAGKFKIASSTAVGTNARLTIDGNGYVGIGNAATSPPTELFIRSAQWPTITLEKGGIGDWQLGTNDKTTNNFDLWFNAVAPFMSVTNGGNVGIGTTSPMELLTVQSAATPFVTTNFTTNTSFGGIRLRENGTLVGALLNIGSNFATANRQNNIELQNTTASGAITFGTNGGAEVMRLTSGGNVGIGTTTPNAPLTIRNAAQGYGLTESWITDLSDVAGRRNWGVMREQFAVSDWVLAVSSARGGPPDTAVMSALSDGKIGIGEVAPGSKLSVSGNATIGASYDTTAAPTNGLLIEGNVGIGTTTPGSKLEINSLSNNTDITNATTHFLRITNSNIATVGEKYGIVFNDAANNRRTAGIFAAGVYGSNSNTDLIFATRPASSGDITERMRIDSAGKVGIGTTPTRFFQVLENGVDDSQVALIGGGSGSGGASVRIGANGVTANVEGVSNSVGAYIPLLITGSTLSLGHSGNTDMHITNGGLVGIGQTNPTSMLTIHNDTADTALFTLTRHGGNTVDAFRLSLDTGDNTLVTMANADITFQAYNGALNIKSMTLTSTGGMTLFNLPNAAGTGYLCETIATGVVSTSTSGCAPSSLRYKNNIQPLSYGLSDVMKLNPVSFTYKPELAVPGNQIGLVAEDTYGIIPEIVGLDSEGRPDNIDYGKLTPVLVKAVQELNGKVDSILNGTATSTITNVAYQNASTTATDTLCLGGDCVSSWSDLGAKLPSATTTDLTGYVSRTVLDTATSSLASAFTNSLQATSYGLEANLATATSSLTNTFNAALSSEALRAKEELASATSTFADSWNAALALQASAASADVASTTNFAYTLQNEIAALASGDSFGASHLDWWTSPVYATIANSTFSSSTPADLVDILQPLEGIEPSGRRLTGLVPHQASGFLQIYQNLSAPTVVATSSVWTPNLAVKDIANIRSLALGDGGITFTDGSSLASAAGLVSTSTLAASLDPYALRSDLGNYALRSDLGSFVSASNLASTTSSLTDTFNAALSSEALRAKEELASATSSIYSALAAISVPDISGLVSTSTLASTLSQYSLRSDLGNYALRSDLDAFVSTTTLAQSLANIPSAALQGTVTGDMIPNADNQYSLGTAQNRFTNIYAKNVNAGDLTFTETTSAISGSTLNTGDVVSLYVSSTAGSTHTVPINLNTAINSNNWSSNNIFFNTSGDFAIGVASTTAPRGKLDVEGAIASGDPRFLTLANTSGSNGNAAIPYSFYIPSTTGDLNIASNDNGQGSLVNNSYSAWNIALGGQSDSFNIKRSGTGTQNYASLLTVRNNGNVGIGTTSPYAMLSVAGQVVGTYFTATSTTNANTFPYASTTAISASGATYFNGLSTIGGFLSTASSTITSGLFTAAGGASTTNLTASGTGYFGNGAFTGTTGTTTIASGQGFTIGSSQFVLQQGSGNVGIGTASPLSRLQIGDATVSTANQIHIGKYEAATEGNLPVIQQKSVLSAGAGNDLALGAQSTSGGILFYTGLTTTEGVLGGGSNAARMAITNAGNVGIGTTSPSSVGLHIEKDTAGGLGGSLKLDNGAASAANNYTEIFFHSGADFNSGRIRSLMTSSSNADMTFFTNNGSETEKMRITGAGNVGIGTTTPGAKLHVEEGSIKIKNWTAGTEREVLFESPNGTQASIGLGSVGSGVGATDRFFIHNNSGYVLTALQTGYVGIGLTAPLSKLEILGSSLPYTYPETNGEGLLALSTGTGAINNNKLIFGVHDGDYSWIQATTPGAGYKNLALQPNGGSVGIGTSTPNNVATVYSATKSALEFSGGATRGAFTMGFDVSNSRFSIASSTALGTTDRFIIDSSGQVGIGAAPDAKLQVVGPSGGVAAHFTDNVNASLYSAFSTTNSGTARLYSDQNLALGANGANDYLTILKANGNVGIGTTSPTYTLSVAKAGAGTQTIVGQYVDTSTSNNVGPLALTFGLDNHFAGNPGSVIIGKTSISLAATSSLENIDLARQLTLIESGNVGIGTIGPDARVQISGGGLCVGSDANCNTDNNTEGIVYSSATAMTIYDVAENYPTRDAVVGPADIVALDSSNGVFVKKAATSTERVLGVISEHPAVLLGGFNGAQFKEERQVAVGLSGRIPVKVNLEGGDIAIGDELSLSSTPGVAKKAADGEQTIGYALENYTTATATNEIQFFITHGSMAGLTVASLTQELSTPLPTLLSEASPAGAFLQNLLARLTEWFASATNGIADFFAGRVHTKELCVGDSSGETCVTKAQLDSLLSGQTAAASAPTSGASASQGGTAPASSPAPSSSSAPSTPSSSSTTSTTTTDTVAPVITINGANPATIDVGTVYADLGASVTDNVDQNLGIKASVDGGPTGDIGNITLDTSVAGDHSIVFTATDAAGNTGSATRTVHVVSPATASTTDPASTTTTDTTTTTTTDTTATSTTP